MLKINTPCKLLVYKKNLSAIRKIAGWTSEQLGERIDVTKQTISNLENGKTPMTLTQYIAIRTVIDFEIQSNKENTVLPQVVEILLNRDEEYTDEEREKISEIVKTIAATASGGIGGAALAAVSPGLLGSILGAPFLAIGRIAAGSVWLSRILKDKDKINKTYSIDVTYLTFTSKQKNFASVLENLMIV